MVIQTAELNGEGSAFEDITGIVEGHNGNTLYVSDIDLGVQLVAIDSINNIQIEEQAKWSCIS